MTPHEIVSHLDRHIVGQASAKRAIAIAVRNRWRRKQVTSDLQNEILPKNILMVGPTGVGKTEIARRLAKLIDAPFIKVEATKFTQVGYVGKDVETIIRDLAANAYQTAKEKALIDVQPKAEISAEEILLDALVPPSSTEQNNSDDKERYRQSREKMRLKLRNGDFDEQSIDINIRNTSPEIQMATPPGMEEMAEHFQELISNTLQHREKKKRIQVKRAWGLLIEQEAHKLLDEESLRQKAVDSVENNGIVFIDEFDKITHKEGGSQIDVSREGVQRDLLPLIEGCSVQTKIGSIKTDHILFVASGAFHQARPQDLITEIQGRLPIRVGLDALSQQNFVQILKHTRYSLLQQYTALLAVDGVDLQWQDDGIERIAAIAWQVNEQNENIGARRLHALLEKLLETVSFAAPDNPNQVVCVDSHMVDAQLSEVMKKQDINNFIL